MIDEVYDILTSNPDIELLDIVGHTSSEGSDIKNLKLSEVKGLVDVNPAAAEKLSEEFCLSGAVIGTDLAGVIAEANADIVFDVVIPTERFNVVSTALDQ